MKTSIEISVQSLHTSTQSSNEPRCKAEIYNHIEQSLKGLLQGAPITWEAALVSLIALLKENMPLLSWVGLYRAQPDPSQSNSDVHLWVGPYQGKLACLYLKPGQGVCGQSAREQKTLIVADVREFEGHVFCDPVARSEIVLPVYQQSKLIGVLDLDSHEVGAFDTIDQKNLEALLKAIEPLSSHVILET